MHIETEVHSLLHTTRVAMLATVGDPLPLASAVPFVPLNGWIDLLLHLSTLAAHTQNLLRNPRVSLLLMESDDPKKNPLALKRLILQGAAHRVDRQDPAYQGLTRQFTDRFPDGAITMTLADFQLWRLRIETAQFIGGFGRAYTAHTDQPSLWTQQGRPEPKP